MQNNGTHRPVANFSPSLWGDQFLNHISNPLMTEKYFKAIEVLKNEVRSKLTAPGSKIVETMNLIDTLERLGISYHFENEIEEKLHEFFNLNTDYEDEGIYDLYTVSLHFRLFRQHGYRITSEIFYKWIVENGEFQEDLKSDARGLLSLYEASYLRIHGETILDDALTFATASLKSVAPNLGSPLREQVVHALVQPLHWGYQRIEARNFISSYEKYENKNESLMRFAKLDYNLLQMLYREEVSEVSRWWKEMGLISKLSYARDRVVECYFWALGVYYEPKYSRARVMLTKSIAIISVIDDTYDAYGTIEELDVFTEAMVGWDIEEIDRLPEYMKPLYKAVLELFQHFEEELAKAERSYATSYAIEELKELVRSYHVEAKWFVQGYLPGFQEYLNNALITSTYCHLSMTSLFGVQSAVREEFEWLSKKPKMLVASLKICRLIDDIGTYEVEKKRGPATGIECYMKEYGATKEEAFTKFNEIATNAWKDSNEELLRPYPCSREVLTRILNLERVIDVVYKYNEDGYTEPEKVLKAHIIALLVDPIEK